MSSLCWLGTAREAGVEGPCAVLGVTVGAGAEGGLGLGWSGVDVAAIAAAAARAAVVSGDLLGKHILREA